MLDEDESWVHKIKRLELITRRYNLLVSGVLARSSIESHDRVGASVSVPRSRNHGRRPGEGRGTNKFGGYDIMASC